MTSRTYNIERDITPVYLAKVDSWIADTGEVLIIIRYLAGGGSKDYGLISSPEQFRQLVAACPEGADIIIMRHPQLPLRGFVSADFIQLAKELVPNNKEYLYVRTTPESDQDPRCWGSFDIGHNMLADDLGEEMDEHVAFGFCPDFTVPDNDDMISASKGGIDGPR